MERTMRRFKEAMSSSMPPSSFVIETKTKKRRQRQSSTATTTKSFSMCSGQVQRRLFSKNIVLLKETATNANSATVLAKGTLCDKAEKENQQPLKSAASSCASFDLELDDSDYEYERQNNSLLCGDNHRLVDELSDSDESDISSIGVSGELAMPPIQKASRLLRTATFPPTPMSVNTIATTPTAIQETNDDVPTLEREEFHLWRSSSNDTATDIIYTGTTLVQARSKMAEGHACLQRKDYTAAKKVFLEASQLYVRIHGPSHTSVALALDAHALACLKLNHTQEGLTCLERVFQIRSHHLGVWHVDTADTYNKMAGAHVQMGHYPKALALYQEVLNVRKALLGPHHPSVAITAHALAKVHVQLGNPVHAQAHFDLAKSVYEQLGMRYNHKDMACLLKDEQLANGSTGDEEETDAEIAEF